MMQAMQVMAGGMLASAASGAMRRRAFPWGHPGVPGTASQDSQDGQADTII